MDETPPPLPVPAGTEPPAPLPPLESPDGDIPLASVATPHGLPPDIPFAHANIPPRFNYSVSHRPGLVTAIGVLAIVVSCLSGIMSLMGGGQAFMFYMISNMAARMGNVNFNAIPQNVTPSTVDTNPLSIADSGMVTTVMQDQLALDGARLRELTELLHKHGSAIFHPDDNAALTSVAVKDAIIEVHKASDSSAAAQFTTAQGRVEIYPDRATFTSTDGATAIHTSAQNHSESVATGTATSGSPVTMPGNTLQPGEVSRAIAAIRQQPGVTVTPAQIATIRQQLSDPNQTLIITGSPQLVYYASNLPNNELQINFNSGQLSLDGTGKVITSTTTGGQFAPFGPKLSVPGQWVAVVISECAVSGLLAIYLFIVGIISLRGTLYSPRLLRIFAVLKIPLAIAAGIGVAALISQSSSGNGAAANGGNQVAAYLFGAGVFVAGIAYPIGVLIALRTEAVRRYFSASDANRP